jgi:CheY-like chemotaxis protein
MPSAKATILIVDDEPELRECLSQIFTARGHCVSSAHDGFSALDKMRQKLPDIILSDLNMPGMSGFDLLSIVHRRFPAIHAIAMSAAFTGSDVPAGVDAKAFYAKGTNLATLLQLVNTAADLQGVARGEARERALPVQ